MFMKSIALVILCVVLVSLSACGGGTSSEVSPQPQGAAAVSISIHDMPPAGVTILSFQASITGIAMQPGNISLLNSPMTFEMTQLQTVSAYMGTISVPAGTYTGMTITLANPQMTFLNDTGGTMGGMMGGGECANGQICQLTPTMMASSVTINGSPFPINLQANTPISMPLDFDLMDSLEAGMAMNPIMTSGMHEATPGANLLGEMDDMIGQIRSINTANNEFTMSFVEGIPSMTISADDTTTFQSFDSIGRPNTIAGLAQGQIVLLEMQLMAGGMLHAAKIRFESNTSQVMDGMIVGISSPTRFDMILLNEAPAFQGLNIGDVVRMNIQAGTMFDVDDTDMPVSGMSFASASDLIVGQMVQIEPASALISGAPAQLNTDHIRLMKASVTAEVASKIDSSTFTVNNLSGIFGPAGISTMKVSTSTQTSFENVSGVSTLSVGDTVSVRGPMFMASGTSAMIASKVLKR
jgi:hypothetical protein